MFDDTLVLHKNMNNVFQLSITDRDRVKLKIEEDSPLKVKFRIISENNVVVTSFYLDHYENGNFWEYIIPKDEVNKLEEGDGYTFTATLYQEDAAGTSEEVPLYVDHNFNIMGTIVVKDNYYDIIQNEYTITEPIVDSYLDDEEELKAKHFFIEHVVMDDSVHMVEVVSLNDNECAVTLDKHAQAHYPVSPKNDQWDTVATFYSVGQDKTAIPLNQIPEMVYFRIIIHTTQPENFKMVVHRIQR